MTLLGAMTLTGTLGIHIFAPALVVASADLRATAVHLQLSISLYIWGLAFGQLIHGPMADRFGRRPVVVGGTALFTVASFASAWAHSAETLIVCRFLQALGGSSGLVIARALVRDTVSESESTGSLARLNLMVLVGPGVGTLLGGFMASTLGWRSIFIALSVMGALNLASILRFLPETRRNPNVSIGLVAANYTRLLRSKTFVAYSIGGGCVTTAWYAFLTVAPFVYQEQLGLAPDATGVHLGIVVAGAWVGSFLASRSAATNARMLRIGTGTSLVAALFLLALFLFHQARPEFVTASMFIFTCGVGFSGPAALALSTSVNSAAIGSASGLYGFTQMAVGASAAVLASLGPDRAYSAIAVLIGAGLVSRALFRSAERCG